MARPKNIDWLGEEVSSMLCDLSLSTKEIAARLGVSVWCVSRHRVVATGLPRRPWGGYGHSSTNAERKARYNAKIKENGYKPLKEKMV